MREMKDSGIEWVGKIPNDWAIKPLYCFFSERKNKNILGKEDNLLSLSYGKIIRKDINTNEGLLPSNYNGYNIVEAGDIVIRPTDLQNDQRSLRTGLVTERGIITSVYIALKPLSNINSRFYHYLLHTYDTLKVFYNMGGGVRQGLSYDEFAKLKIYSPSSSEQQRIADFLDRECGKIDSIIADVEKQIEILEQYKRSVITTIVTKGMSSDIHIRERDQWFGGIPIQWEIARIGSLYKLRNTKVNDRDYAPLSVTMQGVVPQLETAAKTNAHDDRKLVRKGDFVINSRSDRRGSCGISSQDGSVSLINIVLTPLQNMNPSYYNWLFHSVGFSDEFYKWGHGIVDDLWTTTWQDMKNIVIPVPPLEEQQAIADYLDKKCAEIDGVIADKKEQLEVLENYKKSVIYEYVTGKKEVV